MPTTIAMDILNAYKAKRLKNPDADKHTLFKYILWDRLSGRMIMDSELAAMAESSENLFELALKAVRVEKPQLFTQGLGDEVVTELTRFFQRNARDEI